MFLKKANLLLIFLFIISFYLIAGVDQSGNFNYEIGISTPNGSANIQPAISLCYNSADKNNIVGIGWCLEGFSTITRDESFSINFDNNDHYLLDGQKLIYNNNDGYYHTERESYLRIEAFSLNTSDSYWIVTEGNGTKKYYGNTADSHIDAVGKNAKALLWVLNKVEDVHGNYYTIKYSEDTSNGDYYPIKIVYTKNDLYSFSKYQAINFYYENRTDSHIKYIPTYVNIDKRLKWISVNVGTDIEGTGGSLLRKYRLDYEYSTSSKVSRLINVYEYGNDGNIPYYSSDNLCINENYIPAGTTLSPITLSWQEGNDGTFNSYVCSGYSNITNAWFSYTTQFPDINGDGKADWVLSRKDSDYSDVHVKLSKGDGTFEENSIYSGYPEDGTGWQNFKTTFIDVNNDGKADWIRYYIGYQPSIVVRLSNGDGTFQPYFTSCYQNVSVGWANYMIDFADINGDGKLDWLLYHNSIDSTDVHVKFLKDDGTFEENSVYSGYPEDGGGWGNYSTRFVDINGDKKADWVRYYNDQYSTTTVVRLSKGDGTFQPYTCSGSGDGTGWDFYHTNFADIDGDGKLDWLRYYTRNKPTVVVRLAKSFNIDLLGSIKNGNGGTTTITYKPAPQVEGAVDATKTLYPKIANPFSRYLVTNVTTDNGMGDTTSTSYEYYNGQYYTGYWKDMTNLGFEWIKEIDGNSGSYIKTYYRQDKPYHGLTAKIELYDNSDDLYYKKENYFNTRIDDNDFPEIKFIYQTDEYLYNYNGEEDPIEYRIQYVNYDQYGNCTETMNYGDTSTDSDNLQTKTYFTYNSTDHIVAPYRTEEY